jgi:hypothetical protein
MTCNAEIKRRYRTREEAYAYLASRGFLFLPSGWGNGRWAATLDMDNNEFMVTIWLRAQEAA